ncbi:hypothetical protein [Streptomyces niger]|uniref:hypothetical protein n=1 Tax=Streptomyces niger TaxID=66373 RepID=UPI000ACB005F|nr:hypothetical protein [Streptomyces niger]
MTAHRTRAAHRPDLPTTPRSPGGWDTRSSELLAGIAGTAAVGDEAAAYRSTVDGRAAESAAASAGDATVAPREAGLGRTPEATRIAAHEEDPQVAQAAARGPAPEDGAAPEEGSARKVPPRRGPADPVRELMHRHRELCARAVDPLEIAAGLEAHGVTDRTAARFRHRDVFSLAEELYARVPRADALDAAHPADPAPLPSRRVRAVLQALPGALAAATVVAVASVQGPAPASYVRPALAVVGAACVFLALRLCLRGGPLGGAHRTGRVAALWTCWLAGHVLFGDRLFHLLQSGGPDVPTGGWSAAFEALFTTAPEAVGRPLHLPGLTPGGTATAVALCCAVVPAAWCARRFAVHGRRRLAASRGLGEFAARMRPLLIGTVLLFLAAVTALLAAATLLPGTFGAGPGRLSLPALASFTAALALSVLLFLARLLAVHGFPAAAGTGLAAAGALEAVALATLPAGRLPGLEAVARPVEAAAGLLGPAVVPAVACAAAAVGLFAYGLRALTGASAHSPEPGTGALRTGPAGTPPPGPSAATAP